MNNAIYLLLEKIKDAAKALVQFFIILVLGIVAAILYAIPWLLRAAAVLGWLAAGYMGIVKVKDIYGPYSPSAPVLALQFFVILTMVAWAFTILVVKPKNIWGGLAAGGLTLYGVVRYADWLMIHWPYADLFFRVLPPALASVMLIYMTLRLRVERVKNGKISTSSPAFIWLKKS